MSKQFYWATFLMLRVCSVLLGQGAAPQQPASHEVSPIVADIKSTLTLNSIAGNAPAERVQTGRYFRSRDGKSREDFVFGSIIIDKKRGTLVFLNHANKEATLVPIGDVRAAAVAAVETAKNLSQGTAVLGQGQVEGHPIDKKRIEGIHSGNTTEIWTASDIQLPVFIKTTGPDRITTKEYQNIQVLDPDPQLFEIPQDYKIVDKKQFIPPSFSHP